MPQTHTGTCYCGAVVLEMNGAPLDMGYCHCANCRRYSGAPVNAFTLWKADDVKVTNGSGLLGHFESSEISDRRYCTKCGAHVMIDHPKLGLVDVRAAIPSTVTFKPTVHLNYEDNPSNERWFTEAARLPIRNRRLRRDDGGVTPESVVSNAIESLP